MSHFHAWHEHEIKALLKNARFSDYFDGKISCPTDEEFDVLAELHKLREKYKKAVHPASLVLAKAIINRPDLLMRLNSKDTSHLIKALHEFGCYESSEQFCLFYLNDTKSAGDALEVMRAKYMYARCLRGKGEFSAAINIYNDLALSAKNDPNSLDYIYARMMLAKTLDNHEWRIGLEYVIATDCYNRLQETTLHNDETDSIIQRYMAMSLDTICAISIDLPKNHLINTEDASNTDKINTRWDEALEHAESSGFEETISRIKLRRSYFDFTSSETDWARVAHYNKYCESLSRIEDKQYQYRGLGVRYGQKSEMLFALGRIQDALSCAQIACSCSEAISDWRTLIKNQLRLADIQFSADKDSEAFRYALSNAERAIKNTKGSQPELEFEYCVLLAAKELACGRLGLAKTAQENADNVINRMRERIYADISTHLNTDFSLSIFDYSRSVLSSPTCDLTQSEANLAGLIDLNNLGQLQQRLLRSLNLVDKIQNRRWQSQMISTYWDYKEWLAPHRLKNAIHAWQQETNNTLDTALRDLPPDSSSEKEILGEVRNETNMLSSKLIDCFCMFSSANMDFEVGWINIETMFHELKVEHSGIFPRIPCDIDVVRNNSSCANLQLYGNKEALKYAYGSLLENSYQLLSRIPGSNNKPIIVRLSTNVRPGILGGIEIIDFAGKRNLLISAWEKIGESPLGKKHGLAFVKQLAKHYDAEVSFPLSDLGETSILFEFPRNGLVGLEV